MRPGDGKQWRSVCINLSVALRTDFIELRRMPVTDLMEAAKEAAKIINGKHK